MQTREKPSRILEETESVLSTDFADVVKELVNILGVAEVGIIGGVSKASAVKEWIDGKRQPKSREREDRIRFALRIAQIIKGRFGPKTARAWFFGSNHLLDDDMPIYVVSNGPYAEIARPLITAVGSFVGK